MQVYFICICCSSLNVLEYGNDLKFFTLGKSRRDGLQSL